MLIRLIGDADVSTRGDRGVVCKQLHGTESANSMLQHLPRSLVSVGLVGGKIALQYDASADKLCVVTEFRSPQPLTEQQLRQIQECTEGQWSDGLGEGCFDEVCRNLGATIDLLPLANDESTRISQIDDGVEVQQSYAVYHAASSGDLDQVKALLDSGAAIEEPFEDCTPLQIAVLNGYRDVAIELIHRGADVFATDEDGSDALIFTALSNTLTDEHAADIAQLLLERGVAANGERDGLTPLFMARNRSKTRLESVLLKHGATD